MPSLKSAPQPTDTGGVTDPLVTRLTVDRPGYSLAGQAIGDDVPVLLIHHALGTFAGYSDPQIGNVAEWIAARGCRVIGFDLPGHGGSGGRDLFPEWYLERSIGDAQAVLDALEVPVAAVVGVGFGGLVALNLAASAPRRVSCVLADSPPGIHEAIGPEPWPGLNEMGPRAGTAFGESYRAYLGTLSREPGFPFLAGRPHCPGLIVAAGEADGPAAIALHEVGRRAPSIAVATVPGSAPPACWSSPRFFLREAERFLAAYA